MITILRRNQRWLLFIVAVLTIVAFAWLYNRTDTEKLGANKIAQIYGRTLYQIDIDRAVRLQQLAAILGMNEFLMSLTATAESQGAMVEEFVWNLQVLGHESELLWLKPGDVQVLDAIKALPAFSTNGVFDRKKYAAFLGEQLAPRGMTERHLEDLIRSSLAFETLRKLVASPVVLTDWEIRQTMRMFQKVDVLVVRVPELADSEKPKATDEEVASYYEKNKAQLLTPDYRSVTVAEVRTEGDPQTTDKKARMAALQKAAEAISALHEKAQQPGADFAALAAGAQAVVTETPLFDAQGFTKGATPAEKGGAVALPRPVVAEVFRLSAARPLGEIIQDGNSFFVVKLGKEEVPRPLALDEARTKILALLLSEKTNSTLRAKADGFRESIAKAVADGADFSGALKSQGLVSEEVAGLEPWSQTMDEKAFFARTSSEMDEKEISAVERGPKGYYFLCLKSRHPVDPALAATRQTEVEKSLLERKQMLLFIEWLRLAREKSDLRFFHQRS